MRIRGTLGSAASSSGLKSPVSFDCASASSFSVPSVSAFPFSSNSFSSLADAASSPAAINTFPPDAKRADPASLPGPLISLSCMEYTRSRAMTATQSTAAPVRTYCSRSNAFFRLLLLFFFILSYRFLFCLVPVFSPSCYSFRIAASGLKRIARSAGNNPASIPITTAKTSASSVR